MQVLRRTPVRVTWAPGGAAGQAGSRSDAHPSTPNRENTLIRRRSWRHGHRLFVHKQHDVVAVG